MTDQNEYLLTLGELLHRLCLAAVAAEYADVGGTVSTTSERTLDEVRYLQGVVTSRVHRHAPPFAAGDNVVAKPGDMEGDVQSSNMIHRERRGLQAGSRHTIRRVYYNGDGTWSISMEGIDGYRFPAHRFEKVEQQAPAEA